MKKKKTAMINKPLLVAEAVGRYLLMACTADKTKQEHQAWHIAMANEKLFPGIRPRKKHWQGLYEDENGALIPDFDEEEEDIFGEDIPV